MKLELESPTVQNQFFAGDLPQTNALSEESDGRFNEMLKAGIKAAQEGNRAEARHFLLRVTDHQPENETAWLWLASISEYPEELLGFLGNVLRVNPENERALEWAKATKSLMAKTLVQRGITASRENQKELARQFFVQAVEHDAENELAWLWLASVADSTEEKTSHLEKVLSINPENETAQASLKSVRQQTAQGLLKKANVAAISGDHESARTMLENLMKVAPEMEEAWILKAYLASSHEDKLACFEKVLALNPENETARAGIDALNALKEREREAAAQREQLENLQTAAVAEPAGDATESLSEATDADFNAPAAAPADTEPQPYFQEQVNQFVAEAQEVAEDAQQDSPTQELDEEYLESLKEDAGFSFKTEEPAHDFYFADSPVRQPEDAAVEEAVGEEMPAVEMSAGAAEAVASKEFEMVATEPAETENAYPFDAAEEEIHTTRAEYSEPESLEMDSYPFFTVNSYPEGFEQKLAEGLFETEQEEILMEDSFEANVEPSFEDFEFSGSEQDEFQHSEPTPAFAVESPAAFETPEVAFEMSPVAFSAPPENHEAAAEEEEEETTYEIQVAETDTVENYFPSEAPVEEYNFVESRPAAVEERSEEAFVAPRSLSFQAEPFACAFCAQMNEPQAFVCASCRAVLTLSDVEMMLANAEADRQVIEAAVQRMEAEKQEREFSADELTRLGMAHLNLKNLRQGFNYLQEAVQLNPNNVVFGSQVHSLAIRLAEIEEHESKTPEAKSRTIMVVDDSPTVRKLISGKLEKCGHTVVLAVDGMDALAKINEVTPDLILLDITMPRLDGYQVCKLIRNNVLTKDVPVVMISGRDGFFDKVRGRMAGSTGYITKPFGPDTLMRTIEAYFN